MPREKMEGWDKIEEVPQGILDAAAIFAVSVMRGDQISACSIQEANAILVCLAPYSSLASRVLDQD